MATKLDFTLTQGTHSNLKLTLVCDSYQGADVEFALQPLTVAEAAESEDESDDDAMSE